MNIDEVKGIVYKNNCIVCGKQMILFRGHAFKCSNNKDFKNHYNIWFHNDKLHHIQINSKTTQIIWNWNMLSMNTFENKKYFRLNNIRPSFILNLNQTLTDSINRICRISALK